MKVAATAAAVAPAACRSGRLASHRTHRTPEEGRGGGGASAHVHGERSRGRGAGRVARRYAAVKGAGSPVNAMFDCCVRVSVRLSCLLSHSRHSRCASLWVTTPVVCAVQTTGAMCQGDTRLWRPLARHSHAPNHQGMAKGELARGRGSLSSCCCSSCRLALPAAADFCCCSCYRGSSCCKLCCCIFCCCAASAVAASAVAASAVAASAVSASAVSASAAASPVPVLHAF